MKKSLVLIFLIACAGGPKKVSLIKKQDAPEQLKKYKKSLDFYDFFEGKEGLLQEESLDGLAPSLVEMANSSDEPLDQMIGACYQKDWEKAFDLSDQLYSTYKKHPTYWNHLGSCYFLQGNSKLGMIYYNESLALAPRYAPAINNKGVIYQSQQRWDKAETQYSKALKLVPRSRTLKMNLANLYLKFGLKSKACTLMESLNKKSPGDQETLNGLGLCHLLAKRFSHSVKAFEKLSDENRGRPYTAINYALALYRSGSREKALEVIEAVNFGQDRDLETYFDTVMNVIKEGRP